MRAGQALRTAVLEHERRIRGLDHEEAVAIDRDGVVLLSKQGGGTSVSFSDAEMERMRGAAVFTHNHPVGNSFSPEDVAMACTLEFGELRVVTAEWTHVLRPTAAGWSAQDWTTRLSDAAQRAFLEVTDEFRQALDRRRLTLDEANAEFWHRVWERVAEVEGLDYDRYHGGRADAD